MNSYETLSPHQTLLHWSVPWHETDCDSEVMEHALQQLITECNYTHVAIVQYQTDGFPSDSYQDGMQTVSQGVIILGLFCSQPSKRELAAAARLIPAFNGTQSERDVPFHVTRKTGPRQNGWIVSCEQLDKPNVLSLVARYVSMLASKKSHCDKSYASSRRFRSTIQDLIK